MAIFFFALFSFWRKREAKRRKNYEIAGKNKTKESERERNSKLIS
jgi:hypothetical protein